MVNPCCGIQKCGGHFIYVYIYIVIYVYLKYKNMSPIEIFIVNPILSDLAI